MKDWFARLRGKIRRSEDHFPKNLKLSDITPVSKKGNKNLARNYRTVSVLSTLSKLFVKIMRKQVLNYVNTFVPNILQKQLPKVFYGKRCSWKFCKIHRKTPEACNFIKKKTQARTGVFQWTLQDFQEHFFYRTPQDDCFRSVWLQKRAQKYALLSLLETWKKTIDNKYFVEYW